MRDAITLRSRFCAHWSRQIAKVLTHEPRWIVAPSICLRIGSWSGWQRCCPGENPECQSSDQSRFQLPGPVSGIVLVLVVWNRMVPTHLGEAFVKGMSDDVVV